MSHEFADRPTSTVAIQLQELAASADQPPGARWPVNASRDPPYRARSRLHPELDNRVAHPRVASITRAFKKALHHAFRRFGGQVWTDDHLANWQLT
jgi:hypothetical protein